MPCRLSSPALSLMCAMASSPFTAVSFIQCMKTALRVRRPIRSLRVLLAMLSVNITRMVTVLFMTLWYALRKISPCVCRYWTGRVTLALWMVIRRRRCAIPKCVWTALRLRCWRISKRIRSISKKTMMRLRQNPSCCRRASRISWSTALAVSLWVWRRISRRITLAR